MKGKILIIDDDNRNTFALTAVLKSKKFEVVSASSAAEGISMLKNDRGIKIVLLDMMMPEMDGYETLTVIKKQEGITDVPVIAVTAQAMTGDREKCLAAGADGYISKPINTDQLLNILKGFNGNDDDQG
jgi:two-component system cell cycle response regulator DivK